MAVATASGTARAGQAARSARLDQQAGQQAPAGQQPPGTQPPIDLLWRTDADSDPSNDRRLSLLGVSVGANQDGDLTFDGRGQFFAPFGRRSAVQIDGSYAWYHGSREGQLDLGLVNRVEHLQFGLFASVRYVNLKAFDSGGRALSQAGGVLDYVFPKGRIGMFGTAGLRDRAVLGNRSVRRNVLDETYLHLVDQFGASGQIAAVGRTIVEGQLAFLKPADQGRTTGGSLRVVYPIANRWAVTAEGAWNSYMVARSTQGRFTVGVRMRDANQTQGSDGSTRPVPIDIPAIRYQASSRPVRIGNDAPIADAGPDQLVVADCGSQENCRVEVRLDARGSLDPEGDPLTYSWTPRAGFTDERFTMSTTARQTAFEGRAGQTYIVRLQVSDNLGGTAFDEVVITVVRRGQ